MKYNLRWQLLLAVISFGLILSLLSYEVKSSSLCTVTLPAAGGTYAEGIVGAPRYLNPLLSDANPVDREIGSLLFDGLTRYDERGNLVPSLAQSWTVAEDGLSVRFQLRPDVKWHDGEPFSTADVAFTYGLMQDDNYPGPAGLHTLWRAVTINQIDTTIIEFVLPEPYAPFLDATTRGILPAHRLASIEPGDLAGAPFNHSPIGTGPFIVDPGQNWEQTHRLRLIPNPSYWRQGLQIGSFEFRFFADDQSLLEAFDKGEIQAINHVAYESLPQLAVREGVRLFTAPASRYTELLFNLSDSGTSDLHSIEIRRALAYALDRDALIDDVLNGQGLPLEGPYLPTSWAYHPETLTPYDYRPLTSTLLLDTAGWLLPQDAPVRQRDGQPLSLRLLTLNQSMQRDLAQAIAAQWAEVGVGSQLELVQDFAQLQQKLVERAFDVALVEIAPPGDPDYYDFWSQEAIIRGHNYAGWNNQRASIALENGRRKWSIDERRPLYDAWLSYYDDALPALTLFQHVNTFALSGEVNNAEIGRVDHPRDRYQTLADWFLLYRDVTVSCPEGDT
jgi:peptide/nickel transport system substrate-binding protein